MTSLSSFSTSLGALWLNPVAMTVTRISSDILGSMTAPKMILASLPASSKMMDVASSTSMSVKSGPPVMFTNTP